MRERLARSPVFNVRSESVGEMSCGNVTSAQIDILVAQQNGGMVSVQQIKNSHKPAFVRLAYKSVVLLHLKLINP